MREIDFTGRTVLIVGALGVIGQAINEALGECGAKVLLADVASTPEMVSQGMISLDATNQESVAKAFENLTEPITDVVVTVGMLSTGEVRDVSAEEAEKVVEVNLLAPLFLMTAGLGSLTAGSTMTILSSQAAQHGSAGWGIYSATKSALVRLVESAAKEEGPRGIRINAIAPGSVESPMMDRAISAAAKRLGTSEQQVREQYEASSPQGRFVTPEEIADTVVYLISPLAKFVSGQCLIVDGAEGPA